MKTIHLKVTGLVQGVFYRSETKKKANKLGLTGWVRNCEDGSVEIVAQGGKDSLKELERWCWDGPPMAKVENVKRTSGEPSNSNIFEIRA